MNKSLTREPQIGKLVLTKNEDAKNLPKEKLEFLLAPGTLQKLLRGEYVSIRLRDTAEAEIVSLILEGDKIRVMSTSGANKLVSIKTLFPWYETEQ